MNPQLVTVTAYGFVACLPEPTKLPHCACGRMVMFVINRDGATRCVECDAQRQTSLGKSGAL